MCWPKSKPAWFLFTRLTPAKVNWCSGILVREEGWIGALKQTVRHFARSNRICLGIKSGWFWHFELKRVASGWISASLSQTWLFLNFTNPELQKLGKVAPRKKTWCKNPYQITPTMWKKLQILNPPNLTTPLVDVYFSFPDRTTQSPTISIFILGLFTLGLFSRRLQRFHT